jgi:tryptophan-rich sensory protein
MEDAVGDKKSSPKAILVMAIAGWLGAAISVYRIYTQSQKPDGDLFDAILNTVIFALIAVFATIQYRKSKQDQ